MSFLILSRKQLLRKKIRRFVNLLSSVFLMLFALFVNYVIVILTLVQLFGTYFLITFKRMLKI